MGHGDVDPGGNKTNNKDTATATTRPEEGLHWLIRMEDHELKNCLVAFLKTIVLNKLNNAMIMCSIKTSF